MRVLFLCTGNSCRSQMAEGWARQLLAGKVEAFSAGTVPGAAVDPRAVKAMAEAGVDISGQKPKSLELYKGQVFDLVITLCGNAQETCPAYWGTGRKMHRGFDDPGTLVGPGAPDEAAMPHYRRVRDEIRTFVLTLPETLEENK